MNETVWELISTDHQMNFLMIEEDLEISGETIRRILVEHLEKRKIGARFLRTLFVRGREGSHTACQEFVQSVDDDRFLLDAVVTSDETWCFQNDPQINKRSSHQTLRDAKYFAFKSKEQSSAGHILQQSGKSFTKNLFHRVRRRISNTM
jgi:hypothetical protein